LGGCGSAILAAAYPNVGLGLPGVAFAFEFTVVTMAFAVGPISGCYLNLAVSAFCSKIVAGENHFISRISKRTRVQCSPGNVFLKDIDCSGSF